MSGTTARHFGTRLRLKLLLLPVALLQAAPVYSAQTDIAGPAGSVAFGTLVRVLPNGNIVVTDPKFSSNRGAVYLYSSSGTLLSTLTGSSPDDKVGSNGITVLKNGNCVISSVLWNNGAALEAGAATWVDGKIGLSGVVSADNSLVGAAIEDHIGSAGDDGGLGVIALDNGNYLVVSPIWSGGSGAVTWANGAHGLSGFISAANSLVGTQSGDEVGYNGVTLLSNGNYVVASSYWSNASIHFAGAVTWGNGSSGLSGEVSTGNSLVGSTSEDRVGLNTEDSSSPNVTPLANGNYVVTSRSWHNGSIENAGAVTWGDGSVGLVGVVSASNSLVGNAAEDRIGEWIIPLANGNYVVQGALQGLATWTWGNGSTGISGAISASNSLVETTPSNLGNVVPLSNGNYVIPSFFLRDAANNKVGVVTWVDGTKGLSGNDASAITFANSFLSKGGVIALNNGNYVLCDPWWESSSTGKTNVGAVTWVDGSKVAVGAVSAENSLVGASSGDAIGSCLYCYSPGVTALTNGSYVVTAQNSVTWVDGSGPSHGEVTKANSSIQNGPPHVLPLSDGNYVLFGADWTTDNNQYGAIRWGNGRANITGANTASNALVGTEFTETDEFDIVKAVGNGNYVSITAFSQDETGAVSLGRGTGGLVGSVNATTSVIGTVAWGRDSMVYDYDAVHDQLVVGQPASNIISLLKADQLLRGTFE